LDSINLEDSFPKNTLLTVNLTNIESILSFSQGLNQMLSTRKKIITFIQKTSGEILKNIDNIVYNSTKSIKSLITPKSNLINCCAFIKQIREFLKSSFDLIIKKYEELNKYMTNNLILLLDSQLKELIADENLFNQFYFKFSKELNNYKTNLSKLQLNKERASQNIEKIKEQVIKSADDQSYFQKFEKHLLTTITEEDTAKESLSDLNKKFKKFCEENFDFLKKNSVLYKEKETNKNKELKEIIFKVIKQKNKIINHILEYLEFKTQIQLDDQTCIFSIEEIYSNFFKENRIIAFDEKELSELVKFLYSKNKLEDLSLNKLINSDENIPNINMSITSLIKKINFLNKEEIIYLRKESEYLSNSSSNDNTNENIKEEDLKVYYEKLNFLKTNSKKISVRHMFEPKRKRYDDIFYYDDDEFVNINNFSCALSDKILLQGTLYITNKKLVFYSWFNSTNLFGTTLIEIPKNDILDVTKQYNMIFDNSLEVQTRNVNFFITSFLYRDRCYALIRENIFGEIFESTRKSVINTNINLNNAFNKEEVELPNLNTKNNLVDEDNAIDNLISQSNVEFNNIEDKNEISTPHHLINEENKDGIIKKEKIVTKINETNKIKTLTQKDIVEESKRNENISIEKKVELNNLINEIDIGIKQERDRLSIINNPDENNQLNSQKLNKNIFETYLRKKLDYIHDKNYEIYLSKNKREFNIIPFNQKDLGSIPLPYLYNSIFNIENICEEMNLNKSFLHSLMDIRQDYNISMSKPSDDNWERQIPEFYKYKDNQNKLFFELFSNTVEEFYQKFIHDFSNCSLNFDVNNSKPDINSNSDINRKNILGFKFSFVHPIFKKRFMGPSKLNVDDYYRIFFISPKCLIVDNYSYMSGFMMMDCFYSIMQFKFESDYDFISSPEGNLENVEIRTKLTISFGLEFIKTTMFKQKIIDNAIEDTNEFLKGLLYPCIEKIVTRLRNKYSEEKELYKIYNNKEIPKYIITDNQINIIEKQEENVSFVIEKNNIKNEIKEEIIQENIEKNKSDNIDENIKRMIKNIGFNNIIEKLDDEDISIKVIFKENIYLLFFAISFILLILGKFHIISNNTLLVLLNMIGFAIVFEKLNNIERRISTNNN